MHHHLFFMHLFLASPLFFGRLASGGACINSSCRLAAGGSIDMGIGGTSIELEIGGGTISGITGAAVIVAVQGTAVTGAVKMLPVELLAAVTGAVELLPVELLLVELLP